MRKAAFRLLPAVVCLFACLTCSFLAAPAPPVVEEQAMRAELRRDALIITAPVQHPSNFTPPTFTAIRLSFSFNRFCPSLRTSQRRS